MNDLEDYERILTERQVDTIEIQSTEEMINDSSPDDDIIPFTKAIKMLFVTRNTFLSLVKNGRISPPFKYNDAKNSRLFYKKSWIQKFIKERQQAKSSTDETTYTFSVIIDKSLAKPMDN